MSGQATGWVFRHGPHPDHLDRHGEPYGLRARGLRTVLATVADAANADGDNAHPGIEGVMRGSLYGRSRAIELLGELVAEGWLDVSERGGGRGLATVYRVLMTDRVKGPVDGPLPEGNSPVSSVKGPISDPERVQSRPETVHSRVDPNGLTTVRANGGPTRASESFDAFWEAYPLAKAKGAARTAWRKATTRADPDDIIAGAYTYANDPERRPQYTKHPATWLNADCWEDESRPDRSHSKGTTAALRLMQRQPDQPDLRSLPNGSA